jgi:hypothetical protein
MIIWNIMILAGRLGKKGASARIRKPKKVSTPGKRCQKGPKKDPKKGVKKGPFFTGFSRPPPPGDPPKTHLFPLSARRHLFHGEFPRSKTCCYRGGGGEGGQNQLIWGGGILENRSILSRGRGVFGGHFAPFCASGLSQIPAVLLICYKSLSRHYF